MKIFIPILPHPLNRLLCLHWAKRGAYVKKIHRIINAYLPPKPPPLPIRILMTRQGPKMLDGDNLQGSFKNVRDALAMWLVPGTISGQADSHPGIIWQYEQATANSKSKLEKGIIIQIDQIEADSINSLQ